MHVRSYHYKTKYDGVGDFYCVAPFGQCARGGPVVRCAYDDEHNWPFYNYADRPYYGATALSCGCAAAAMSCSAQHTVAFSGDGGCSRSFFHILHQSVIPLCRGDGMGLLSCQPIITGSH
jgi:hypothetical protein|eukprot:COSAG01_NODE_7637_length_3117_cov_227.763167_3_plen_120_part_00